MRAEIAFASSWTRGAAILAGRYRRGDCTGEEKARRISDRYDLQAYEVVYV